ncbi:S-adenosylmethionine carrier 1, chloroplastic/mitochondrial [Coccomyxa sp. Obi]|nr:S-adenosylmethionine carrier 1, chloroplastic/mitochondrial [Coccomyxa sp. Obi]
MRRSASKVGKEGAVTSQSYSAPPPAAPDQKPVHDVMAGAMARAASQGTIHPLDTLKVQMQVGKRAQQAGGNVRNAGRGSVSASQGALHFADGQGGRGAATLTAGMQHHLAELRNLYKGVFGAATGAGIIIGTYFAFYSTTKNALRRHTSLHEGAVAFVAGATAAVGSSVVKVPLAVCIRSVQAGLHPNPIAAAQSLVRTAGVRSLFTGFLPTLLEDVPDMAVKFAVYETLRPLHHRVFGGRQPTVVEDLLIGGAAGAAAAAVTTPLDVVKTVMMCSASSRPTLASASARIMAEGRGAAPFFRGVGPRSLSNGLNSAIFFCFFEALRGVLQRQQLRADSAALACCTLSGAATRNVPVLQLAGGASQIATYRSNVRGPGSGCHIRRRAPIASLSLALPC